jgi:hypothetical protein
MAENLIKNISHNPCLTRLTNQDINLLYNRQWYFDKNYNQPTLLITAGDSWTWGDSLGGTNLKHDNFEHRTNHIYGHLLAKKLSSDFINIGMPGFDNVNIILNLEKVLDQLTKSYKQINVVITLTETGREFTNIYLTCQDLYTNILAGPDWPTFEEIVNNTYNSEDLAFAIDELSTQKIDFLHHLLLYLKIKSATSVVEVIELAEKYTLNMISTLAKQFTALNFYVARNFTSFVDVTSVPNNITLIDQRWVDVIANQGKLTAYPDPLYLMSNIAITPVTKFIKHLNIQNSKLQLLNLIEQSLLGINWLSNSPFNSQVATKHPLEQGHQWWCEHLYNEIIL